MHSAILASFWKLHVVICHQKRFHIWFLAKLTSFDINSLFWVNMVVPWPITPWLRLYCSSQGNSMMRPTLITGKQGDIQKCAITILIQTNFRIPMTQFQIRIDPGTSPIITQLSWTRFPVPRPLQRLFCAWKVRGYFPSFFENVKYKDATRPLIIG